MFTNINELLKNKEYKAAEAELFLLLEQEDKKICAKANYYIGYINLDRDNKGGNKRLAKIHLRENLNSDYPQPYAYVLYSEVEEDKNVALNYLKLGQDRFPNDSKIMKKVFQFSSDKDEVIKKIKEQGFNDFELLCCVIEHLIVVGQWEEVSCYIFRLKKGNDLSDYEENYFDLLEAYSKLFKGSPDYKRAREIFECVIKLDIDNDLAYAHYLGVIYACIMSDDLESAIGYFDKIPVNNSIYDFDDGPFYPVKINFEKFYETIFKTMNQIFDKDRERKVKSKALYALYLYNPSEIYDVQRYKKSDLNALARYMKVGFNPVVAGALYHMYSHYKQYLEAFAVLHDFLANNENPEKRDVYFSEIMYSTNYSEFCKMADYSIKCLEKDLLDLVLYKECIFEDLIRKLFEINQYNRIAVISEYMTDNDRGNGKSKIINI